MIRFPINAPPKPPPKQPSENAITLTLKVLIPIIFAATSSSLTALRMPPKFDLSIQTIQIKTTPRQLQLINSVVCAGMPFKPNDPFVNLAVLVIKILIISENPSVAIPR